jgi:hypothetical protein
MNYTDSYNNLKEIFSAKEVQIKIPWSDISIFNLNYQSMFPESNFINVEDKKIEENFRFTYPVFAPAQKSSRVILLLHGLNERSWIKYLSWAHTLAQNTSSYVVLFPISFHINRSPDVWSNPREMIAFMNNRYKETGDGDMLSFANAALSERLSKDPMRFFNSGYQTAMDLIDLLTKIRDGRHEIIPAGCRLNIFAYSIGAFLGGILMLGNPEELFSNSKIFMFCGGSFFSGMNGRSKLIMDNHAFNEVFDFYLSKKKKKNKMLDNIHYCQLGLAFKSMLDKKIFRSFREKRFIQMRDQIRAIAFAKDAVIPAECITKTLNETGSKHTVSVKDFQFTYSHETPFPILKTALSAEVDKSFDSVFSEAAVFLS